MDRMKKGKIVVVDDNLALLRSVRIILSRIFEQVVTLPLPTLLPAVLKTEDTDVVLLDMNFLTGKQSGEEGLFWLDRIREVPHPPAVVLMTAYAGIELAVAALKKGASDFIVKPWENEKLVQILHTAYEERVKQGITDTFVTVPEQALFLPSALVSYLINKYTTLYGKQIPLIDPEVRQNWEAQVLDGDLEQLEECIERTILLNDTARISLQHVFPDQLPDSSAKKNNSLEEMEKQFISRVVKEHKGNLSTVARQLNISRQTLYNKIKKYNL